MEQQFKVKLNTDPAQNMKSFVAKMDKSDWIFLFSYITILMVSAMIVDFSLYLIDSKYIFIPGIFLCGHLLRNRVMAKENKK